MLTIHVGIAALLKGDLKDSAVALWETRTRTRTRVNEALWSSAVLNAKCPVFSKSVCLLK